MHPSCRAWVAAKVTQHHLADRSTLEVGSYNVNGSIRDLFTGPYTGVDMRPGPGVDHVAYAHQLPFPDRAFAVVVCTEMLEHDPAFWLSVPEMARVLRPGGHLILTARGNGFPRHDYPGDYWRFTDDSFRLLFDRSHLTTLEIALDDPASPGVFGLAVKATGRAGSGWERRDR